MKKITQPVSSDFVYKPLKKMLAFAILLLCLCSGITVFAQSPVYFTSGDFTPPNNWAQGSASLMGTIVGTNIITTSPKGSGNQYFRFYSATSGGTNFSPNVAPDIQLTSGVAVTLQTNTGNQGKAYYMSISNSWATSKVVMKTVGSGTTAKVAAFEIQGAVRTISSVSRTPTTPNQSQAAAITATLDGALATGQGIWLRYTTNAFSSSTLVRMTG